MTRKNILILVLPILAALICAILLYTISPRYDIHGRMEWKYKGKEVMSRLLSIPILLYHNIDGAGRYSIELEELRKHFQLIRNRGIRVIPLRELINRLENPVPFDEKVLVITFDDDYPAMYTKLLPLAREFKFPMTLFIYTNGVNRHSGKALTWEKLRELDENNIDIQAHSISHANLTRFSSRDDIDARKRLFKEMYLSKRILELHLGKRIDYFAYPEGEYDLRLIEISSFANFKRVFSTDYGSNVITRDNFCLRRQHLTTEHSLHFLERIIQEGI
jgi:peptidoglycan/xylan/chitin deacetylase (PgdA/CDA1 family)